MRGLGVDAAGGFGWVGVVIGDQGFQGALVDPTLAGLIEQADAGAPSDDPITAIGVDIPIGLIEDSKRSADVEMRLFVGPRRSSVFWAPHRSALEFPTQSEANAHLASLGMSKVSAQMMGLMPRIRETRPVAAADERVFEAFPEASFRQLAGFGLAHSKKTAAGALQRLELLAGADPAIELPAETGEAGRVPLDDLFDAAAAGWSAWRRARGVARSFGDLSEIDPVTGPIAVWV